LSAPGRRRGTTAWVKIVARQSTNAPTALIFGKFPVTVQIRVTSPHGQHPVYHGASFAQAGLADAKIAARLADMGGMPLIGSPADYGKLIADETAKWGKVIRDAGIKAE
jgi:hypothetical protein